MGSGKADGGGTFPIVSDQIGDVTLIQAVAQAPRTLTVRSRCNMHGW